MQNLPSSIWTTCDSSLIAVFGSYYSLLLVYVSDTTSYWDQGANWNSYATLEFINNRTRGAKLIHSEAWTRMQNVCISAKCNHPAYACLHYSPTS